MSTLKNTGSALTFIQALTHEVGDKTMPIQQAVLLLTLFVHGEMSQADLLDHTGVSDSSISRNINKLGQGETKYSSDGPGLVERVEDQMDRRAQRVRLTPKGRASVEKAAARAWPVTQSEKAPS